MPTYSLYENHSSSQLNIVLPGTSVGFEVGFIKKIVDALIGKKVSTVTLNYPFQDQGKETYSGDELIEEVEAVKSVLAKIDMSKYDKIHFIGKSLGAIIAEYYLRRFATDEVKAKSNFIILGYVIDGINLENLSIGGTFTIIQGQKDRFGDLNKVKNDLKLVDTSKFTFYEIPGADHSYRDENQVPAFEDEVVNLILETIGD